MSKLRITVTAGLVGLAFLVGLMLLSCDAGRKGKERQNRPPTVKFSNVPPDSAAFSFNPEVSWYALDIDGYVIKYQYAVIIGDSLHVVGKLWNGGGTLTAADSACSVLVRIPPEAWVDSLRHIDSTIVPDNIDKFISAVDTTVSIVKVQLFARENPNDTITQHLFVRAIDNDNAVSNVIHRMFSRNNHKPKASISYIPFRSGTDVKSVYCLPETTQTWKGIKLTWDGSDSDDYKGTQPDFVFKWELWGPFADSFAVINNKTEYDQLRSSSDSVFLVSSSFNETDSNSLVEDKSLLLTGLVNSPHLVRNIDTVQYPDLGYGWYLFIAWTMDDAFVFSDPFTSSNPDGHLWFKIVHPQFTYQSDPSHSSNPVRKILVYDYGNYGRGDTGGEKDSVNVRLFYQRAVGALMDSLCNTLTFRKHKYQDLAYFSNDTLSRYDLVIYLNEGKPQDVIGVLQYKEYLKVGGKVWAIGNGPETFGVASASKGLNFFEDVTSSLVPYADYAMTYFGLLGVYDAGWSTSGADRNEEFIGANPYGSALDLPVLKTDTIKVRDQINWSTGAPDSTGKLAHTSYTYLGKATRIYTFVSAFPATSVLHFRPCGSIYEGPLGPDGHPIYKTAHLSFGLHFIDEGVGGATRDSLFSEIVRWFWED
ncbi:MAG TPA: hypothetical protein VGB16_03925 [candidate division Zixibacteria bacterium]